MNWDNVNRGEAAQIIRERLDRENELLAHRTSWTVASQSFLLSAYAACVVGTASEPANPHASALESLVTLLPWTAVTSLLVLYVAVAGGLLAMFRLARTLEPVDAREELLFKGPCVPRIAGLLPPVLVPAVFLLTWAVVLSRQ